MNHSLRFVILLALVWSVTCTAATKDCLSICVEARIMDGYWVLMTVDSHGEVLQMEKTEARADQPLDQWFTRLQYNPLDPSTRNVDVPPPPPDGTGVVSDSDSHSGWNEGKYGTWYITIEWVFQDFELVDIRVSSFFKARPTPPPGGNQEN